jgi:antitoxin MazE
LCDKRQKVNTKIQKWGNSLALRIPKAFADQVGLAHDSVVQISLEGDRIIIEPAARPRLEDLLGAITTDNLHSETDWGAAAGQEIG